MTSTARPAPARRTKRRARRATPLDRAAARLLAALERPEAPYLVLLAGFLVAGLFLRLDGLGAQSLWFDEADAVMMARADLGTLLRNIGAAGQNGPLYILFLHAWTSLFGLSEFAVRLPSALAGTAAIPLIYATGRALHGPKLGLYAAGIVTVAPYQHWYAQEAKMYAAAVLATLAATYLFILALRDDSTAHWLGYVAAGTLALYLHVTTALVLAAQALYASAERGMRNAEQGKNAERGTRNAEQGTVGIPPATNEATASRARSIPRSALRAPRSAPIPRSAFRVPRSAWAFAALTLPYLPIAAWELRFVFGPTTTWHRPIGPLAFLRDTFTPFAAGFRADGGTEARALALYAALALLGALPLAWRHAPWPAPALSPRRRAALLVLMVALPLALFYAVTLIRPLFNARYLMIVTPAFYLLAAGGILVLERFARALAPVALALLLATAWAPLRDVNLVTNGPAQKEDWRAAYRHIAAHAHPNDLILIHPGYLQTTLDYYRLRGLGAGRLAEVPAATLPAEATEVSGGAYDLRRFQLAVEGATIGYERVWVVVSEDRLAEFDPKDLVRAEWFRYNSRLIDERRLNGVWLGLYAYNRAYGLNYYPPVPVRLNVALEGRLTLVGYGFDFRPDQSSVRPGEHVPLVLRWLFPSPQAGPFLLGWRLQDERGRDVPGAGGSAPLLGGRPLDPWTKPGEIWDYHDLPLPPDLAPGRYRLIVEVWPAGEPRRPLAATPAAPNQPGGAVPLGWIEVR